MVIDSDFEVVYLLVAFALLGAILVGALISAIPSRQMAPAARGRANRPVVGRRTDRSCAFAHLNRCPVFWQGFWRLLHPSFALAPDCNRRSLKRLLSKCFRTRARDVMYSAYVVKATQRHRPVRVTP